MKPASYWIDRLELNPHPEGGFYKETYRAEQHIPHNALAPAFAGSRPYSTAIYFLLRAQDRSHFHRIKSDEMWHYHAGDSLMIYVLFAGVLKTFRLGSNLEAGDQLQVVVPADHWFGASVIDGDYALAGCTVAPGFDFDDFEMATRGVLLKQYPEEKQIIELLTRGEESEKLKTKN